MLLLSDTYHHQKHGVGRLVVEAFQTNLLALNWAAVCGAGPPVAVLSRVELLNGSGGGHPRNVMESDLTNQQKILIRYNLTNKSLFH